MRSSPGNTSSRPPLKKKVTWAYFSVSARRNWLRPCLERMDLCLGRMNTAVKKTDTCLLLTSDHGNAEMMYDETLKSPHTAHTTNPVPFIMVNGPTATLHHGKLCDIAPTILQILDLPQPSSMTGCSLLELKYG